MSKGLIDLRKKIDTVDRKIVKNLTERFILTEKVGKYKKKNKIKAHDKDRETEMLKKRIQWAKEMKLNEETAKKVFRFITKLVKQRHRKIANK